MSSIKQIEANRRNAQRSTGPKTAAGKAVSRLNALGSGIWAAGEVVLPVESPEDLAALTTEYYESFHPTTPEQRCLVDCLVSDEWMLRRFRRIEAESMSRAIQRAVDDDEDPVLSHAYFDSGKIFDRLQQRINATRKSYLKTLQALNGLQSRPQPCAPQPQAAGPSREERSAPAPAEQGPHAVAGSPYSYLPFGFVPPKKPGPPVTPKSSAGGGAAGLRPRALMLPAAAHLPQVA